MESLVVRDRNGAATLLNARTELFEGKFGMVAGPRRFRYFGFPLRIQTRE